MYFVRQHGHWRNEKCWLTVNMWCYRKNWAVWVWQKMWHTWLTTKSNSARCTRRDTFHRHKFSPMKHGTDSPCPEWVPGSSSMLGHFHAQIRLVSGVSVRKSNMYSTSGPFQVWLFRQLTYQQRWLIWENDLDMSESLQCIIVTDNQLRHKTKFNTRGQPQTVSPGFHFSLNLILWNCIDTLWIIQPQFS